MPTETKGFFITIVISAVMLGGFVLFDQSDLHRGARERVGDSVETSKTDVALWKTYRNEEYGFEVKYLGSFMEDSAYNGGVFSTLDGARISFFVDDPNREGYWDIEKHLQEREVRESNIDGMQWHWYIFESEAVSVRYVYDRDGIVFVFGTEFRNDQELRKILSMFKFIEGSTNN